MIRYDPRSDFPSGCFAHHRCPTQLDACGAQARGRPAEAAGVQGERAQGLPDCVGAPRHRPARREDLDAAHVDRQARAGTQGRRVRLNRPEVRLHSGARAAPGQARLRHRQGRRHLRARHRGRGEGLPQRPEGTQRRPPVAGQEGAGGAQAGSGEAEPRSRAPAPRAHEVPGSPRSRHREGRGSWRGRRGEGCGRHEHPAAPARGWVRRQAHQRRVRRAYGRRAQGVPAALAPARLRRGRPGHLEGAAEELHPLVEAGQP